MIRLFLAVNQIYNILCSSWIFLLCNLKVITSNACTMGWTGPNCRFKCNCQEGCLPTGDCASQNDSCLETFFGDGCQYRDLAQEEVAQTSRILTDSDDSTCMNVVNESIFFAPQRLTFFRVVAEDEVSLERFSYQVKKSGFDNNCIYLKYNISIRPLVRDYYCRTISWVNEIVLKSDGSAILCTVNVNGGRNLALKQQYEASSFQSPETKGDGGGVDGETSQGNSGDYEKDCFSTNESDLDSFFIVRFNVAVRIYAFVITNRPEPHLRHRLSGFVISTYNSKNETIMSVRDNGFEGRQSYRVRNEFEDTPLSYLKLGKDTQTSEFPLQFCELEAFGDCDYGSYGLDCSEQCGQCSGGSCRLFGDCLDKHCEIGAYGPQCDQACPHCLDGGQCDAETGACLSGCAPGYEDDCRKECEQGYYGQGCKMKCTEMCRNCSNIDGKCYRCSNGRSGEDCRLACSKNCGGTMACHPDTGKCIEGCAPGFGGVDCREAQVHGQSPAKDYTTHYVILAVFAFGLTCFLLFLVVVRVETETLPHLISFE